MLAARPLPHHTPPAVPRFSFQHCFTPKIHAATRRRIRAMLMMLLFVAGKRATRRSRDRTATAASNAYASQRAPRRTRCDAAR